MSTITKHTDTYWTNRYGGKFCNEESERQDEERRNSAEWIIKIIGTQIGEPNELSLIQEKYHIAIDDSKAPWTSQPDGKCTVYLFKDMIEVMQGLITKYGDNVGYTNHHCGMSHYSKEMVLLLPFAGQEKPTETRSPLGGGR